MSAKKCRQKKKDYLNNLEEQVEKYKIIINQYENILKKNQCIENGFNKLNEKEKYLLINDVPDSKAEEIKKEYKNEKILLLNKLLKLEDIEENDDIQIMKNKINNNISMYILFFINLD